MLEYALCTCVNLGIATFRELDILPSRVPDTGYNKHGPEDK